MATEENSGMEDDAPASRGLVAKLLPMIMIGAAGLLVLILIGGEIYAVAKARALQSEVTTVRKELKERGRVAGEQQAQLTALAQQVDALKADLAAKMAEIEAKNEAAKAAEVKPVAEPPAKPGAPAAAQKTSVPAEKQPPAAKAEPAKPESPKAQVAKPDAPGGGVAKAEAAKAKAADAFSCDLSGKSPEEQAKILKRCVSVMDMPPPAPAGKR